MRPVRSTRIGTLVLIAVIAAVLAYLLVRGFYGSLPPLTYVPSITVGIVAVIEGGLARTVRARILRRPGTTPIESLQAARMLALAKASAVVGAVVVGLWVGALVYVGAARTTLSAAGDDVPVAIVGVATSLLLVAAALWLEHSCRTPDLPEDEDDDDRDDLGSLHD